MTHDPKLLAAHEISHLLSSGGGSIRCDTDGWTVVSNPPASEFDLLNGMLAGIIGEHIILFGLEIARIKLKDDAAWNTEIGADDYQFISHVPVEQRLATFDRVAPFLARELAQIGRQRLKSFGDRLLQANVGDVIDFGEIAYV